MYPSEILFGSPGSNFLSLSFFIAIFFLHGIIGNAVLGGVSSLLSRSFVGLSVNAAIVTLLVNFSGLSARIYIMVSLIVLTLINLIKISQKKFYPFRVFIRGTYVIYPTIILIGSLALSLIAPYFNDGIYNGHWTYYSGISLEMIQADYNSRLRILDNYPAVWPKYHFFQASMHAIFLVFLPNPTYAEYSLSKYLILALIITISWLWIRKQFIRSNTAVACLFFVSLLTITIFRSNIHWALFSNNLLPNFALLASIDFLRRKNTMRL
jgi:hypothetical protein